MNLKTTAFFLLAVLSILTISCGRNRLKTDEKALSKQILTEEEQLAQQEADRLEKEKQWADSLAKLPKGFRFKEDRKVDPKHLPQVIDIAGNLENVKDVKLSAVASDIKYIKMEAIPDSAHSQEIRFNYYLMDNYIVGVNLYGIHLFSKEGRFIRTIVKNEYTGLTYDKKRNMISTDSHYTEVGSGSFLWSRGNHLFYPYTNDISGEKYIMDYDCSDDQPSTAISFDSETKKGISGLGKVFIDGNPGQKNPNPKSMYWWLRTFSPDRYSYVVKMKGKHMMGIIGVNGDTITTFTKYEQVNNYSKSIMRGTDRGDQYEKGGSLFIRTDFNDTIFQVIPPNKLLPVYVLNLGQYKVTKQQGIDPEFNLKDKIIPQNFAETKDYLFFTFDRDNYDCPYNRMNKTLKLYHGIYSKRDRETIIIKSDPLDYEAPLLQNDIDGGPSVWPSAYRIGRNGEILVSLTGSELKASVKSDNFTTSTAPVGKKEKLKQLAAMLSDQDDVLMIVK